MGYADVGADIFIALGLVAFYAGGATPLAFIAASITYLATGLAYAELATAYPYAGGAQVYAMRAFNDLVGFVAGWAVMLDYTVNIALFSLAASGYLSFFLPVLNSSSALITLPGGIALNPDQAQSKIMPLEESLAGMILFLYPLAQTLPSYTFE